MILDCVSDIREDWVSEIRKDWEARLEGMVKDCSSDKPQLLSERFLFIEDCRRGSGTGGGEFVSGDELTGSKTEILVEE